MTFSMREAWRLGHLVHHEAGPGGNPRHAQARLIQVLLGDVFEQHGAGARVHVDGDTEGLGDGVGGDVVMGRADAAGGEDVVEAGA